MLLFLPQSSDSNTGSAASGIGTTSAKGEKPGEKLHGSASHFKKTFDKSVRGFSLQLSGVATSTKLIIPKDDRKTLGLIQPFLVIQCFIESTAHFSFELTLRDQLKQRHRLLFSTSFHTVTSNALHLQLPLDILKRDCWLNLTIDLHELCQSSFHTSFRCLDTITITAACKLRRIFTLKSVPVDSTDDSTLYEWIPSYTHTELIPRVHEFPIGVEHKTQLYCMSKIQAAEVKLLQNVTSVNTTHIHGSNSATSSAAPTPRVPTSHIPSSSHDRSTHTPIKSAASRRERIASVSSHATPQTGSVTQAPSTAAPVSHPNIIQRNIAAAGRRPNTTRATPRMQQQSQGTTEDAVSDHPAASQRTGTAPMKKLGTAGSGATVGGLLSAYTPSQFDGAQKRMLLHAKNEVKETTFSQLNNDKHALNTGIASAPNSFRLVNGAAAQSQQSHHQALTSRSTARRRAPSATAVSPAPIVTADTSIRATGLTSPPLSAHLSSSKLSLTSTDSLATAISQLTANADLDNRTLNSSRSVVNSARPRRIRSGHRVTELDLLDDNTRVSVSLQHQSPASARSRYPGSATPRTGSHSAAIASSAFAVEDDRGSHRSIPAAVAARSHEPVSSLPLSQLSARSSHSPSQSYSQTLSQPSARTFAAQPISARSHVSQQFSARRDPDDTYRSRDDSGQQRHDAHQRHVEEEEQDEHFSEHEHSLPQSESESLQDDQHHHEYEHDHDSSLAHHTAHFPVHRSPYHSVDDDIQADVEADYEAQESSIDIDDHELDSSFEAKQAEYHSDDHGAHEESAHDHDCQHHHSHDGSSHSNDDSNWDHDDSHVSQSKWHVTKHYSDNSALQQQQHEDTFEDNEHHSQPTSARIPFHSSKHVPSEQSSYGVIHQAASPPRAISSASQPASARRPSAATLGSNSPHNRPASSHASRPAIAAAVPATSSSRPSTAMMASSMTHEILPDMDDAYGDHTLDDDDMVLQQEQSEEMINVPGMGSTTRSNLQRMQQQQQRAALQRAAHHEIEEESDEHDDSSDDDEDELLDDALTVYGKEKQFNGTSNVGSSIAHFPVHHSTSPAAASNSASRSALASSVANHLASFNSKPATPVHELSLSAHLRSHNAYAAQLSSRQSTSHGSVPRTALTSHRPFTPAVVPLTQATSSAPQSPDLPQHQNMDDRISAATQNRVSPPFTHQLLHKAPGQQLSNRNGAAASPRDASVTADSLQLSDSEHDIDLMYDPILKCYYNPKNNQYYELKS